MDPLPFIGGARIRPGGEAGDIELGESGDIKRPKETGRVDTRGGDGTAVGIGIDEGT